MQFLIQKILKELGKVFSTIYKASVGSEILYIAFFPQTLLSFVSLAFKQFSSKMAICFLFNWVSLHA